MAKKVEKGHLVLDRPLQRWLDLATTTSGLYVAELTTTILIESCQLPQPFHGDPADQIIVASVRHHNAQLITKDRRLYSYPHVRTIW
ncbi:PIN domain-containing protein [Acidobacteria bacterium AH-259-O06]|nr:PIN domain-containing protein [Acidobacteria bacterium AH-259-O06]